jgi:hypothetical protein
LRFCASCGRFFWPGSHRKRMTAQLEEWDFWDDITCLSIIFSFSWERISSSW